MTAPDDLSDEGANVEEPFDFDAHGQRAVDEYVLERPTYEAYSEIVASILRDALERRGTQFHSVEPRAKALDNCRRNAMSPSDENPNAYKYQYPLDEITDLSGVRVITFFPRTIEDVGECIRDEFVVIEELDLGRSLLEEDRCGYQSVHYLIRLTEQRTPLPEYQRFDGLISEVQVRTVLQHAWAETEHHIQYKSAVAIPQQIRRRFMGLSSLLEVADREFQATQDEDTTLREQARASVQEGALSHVEITPDSLKT